MQHVSIWLFETHKPAQLLFIGQEKALQHGMMFKVYSAKLKILSKMSSLMSLKTLVKKSSYTKNLPTKILQIK